MMLRMGINGQFGKSNKNFSYEVLIDWANQYDKKWLEYNHSNHQKKKDMDIHNRISPTINEPMAIIIPPHLKTVKEIDEHFNKVKK